MKFSCVLDGSEHRRALTVTVTFGSMMMYTPLTTMRGCFSTDEASILRVSFVSTATDMVRGRGCAQGCDQTSVAWMGNLDCGCTCNNGHDACTIDICTFCFNGSTNSNLFHNNINSNFQHVHSSQNSLQRFLNSVAASMQHCKYNFALFLHTRTTHICNLFTTPFISLHNDLSWIPHLLPTCCSTLDFANTS